MNNRLLAVSRQSTDQAASLAVGAHDVRGFDQVVQVPAFQVDGGAGSLQDVISWAPGGAHGHLVATCDETADQKLKEAGTAAQCGVTKDV